MVACNESFLRLAPTRRLPPTWPRLDALLARAPAPTVVGPVELTCDRVEHEGAPAVLLHARFIGGDTRYRALFGALNDGVIIARAVRDAGTVTDWIIEEANEQVASLVNSPADGLVSHTGSEAFPERLAQLHPQLLRVLADGVPLEYRRKISTGIELFVRFVRLDPERIGVVTVDMTKTAAAERALADSHERFERMVATSPGVMFEFENLPDGSGAFTYVSPRCRELLEIDAKTLLEDHVAFDRLLTPESQRGLRSDATKELRKNEVFTIDLELVTPLNRRRWVRYTRRIVGVGDVVRGSGVMVDVTDEIESREALAAVLADAVAGQELLDVLLAHVPSGIIVTELTDGKTHRLSEEVTRLLGFTPTARELVEDVRMTDANGVVLTREHRPLGRALATGAPVRDLELTLEARGVRHTVLANASVVTDRGGKPRTGIVAWHDITSRKVAEAALFEEKELLRVTLRSIGDAVITTDVDARVTMLNPVAEQLTGWSNDDARGKPLAEVFRIIDEGTRASIESPAARVLAEGVVVGLANHTLLITRSGAELPIADAGAPIKGDSGRISGVVIVFRDQVEERKSELAIEHSRAGLLTIIDNLPIGIFVTRNEKLIYANPAFVELLGYPTAAAIAGLGPTDFLIAEDAAPRTQPPGKIFSGRVWRARRADGQFVVVETAPLRHIEFDGGPAVLWAVRDLSELRAIQAQLMQADRLASLGMLAAGIAHEINNPLAFTTASLSYLDETMTTIGSRLSEDERGDITDLLSDARMGATRVRDVVRDLKAFSRSEDEPNQPVDLLKLLDSSLQLASTEIRHRSKLVRDYGPVPLVSAHEARLGQVFLNLFVNAAQAIPEGRAHENEIRIATRTSALGQAVVEISDTGPGISPDALDRIFDPFFTTKPIGVGTGIGLAICRSTIVALGGEIRAVNRPGGGAMFVVSLPPAAAITTTAPPSTEPLSISARRGRMLVIDDEPTIGALVRRALHRDHDVVVLDAARAAADLLDAGQKFDVIICDVMMPDMTGIELYTHLAAAHPDQASRVVFLTGGAFTPKSAEFMEMVPNLRVEKPFEVAELRSLIAKLVG
ncbi:hypothetical protein BH09MYX1_BH09MYX1_09240 [soil metagenome]